ncbi:DUF924 family protein [Leptolyngbya ohadii]|uniref:DUF924 family protein n=1 Tax=Leptolyngbya ohadii TaxID=1962290 RepID=UPI000B59B328|nr:DUF924 family protein [Leptolyngbya ohadii]
MTLNPAAAEVFSFWFGESGEDTSYAARRKLWFGKAPEFDRAIADRFRSLTEQATAGELDSWQRTPQGALALLILLDQFPRNIYRGTPQAFGSDLKALAVAKTAIDRKFDQELEPIQRIFMYLPLEHSEMSTNQARSVALFKQLAADSPELQDTFDYAIKHQVVIDRFGRFPHRNEILGRESTAEEVEFLKQPGSSF